MEQKPFPARSAEPWKVHFGLECPTANPYHQPHPDPWWSGESVFAPEGQRFPQPAGPFYHGIIRPDWDHEILKPGDYLLSPAERRIEVPRIAQRIASDGCIYYRNYDVHGVYLTIRRALVANIVYYEVEPEGLLWPDPERPVREDWCCSRARVLSVHGHSYADPALRASTSVLRSGDREVAKETVETAVAAAPENLRIIP